MEYLIIVFIVALAVLWIASKFRKGPVTGTEANLTSMALSSAVDPRPMTLDSFCVWLGGQYSPYVLEMYRDLVPVDYPGVAPDKIEMLDRRIRYLQGHRSDVVDVSEEAMREDYFWRDLEARADREGSVTK